MRLYGCLLAIGLGFAAKGSPAVSPPFFFIEDAPNRFLIRVPGTTAVFTPEGIEFHTGGELVRANFQAADDVLEMQGVEPMGHANFLVGQDPSAWRTGLSTYKQIRYANLYRGIDALYSGTDGRVKSEYRVSAGADPHGIQVKYSVNLSIDAEGRLHAGNLIES